MVVMVWQRHDSILAAYTDDRPPVQFAFDGLDVEINRRADLGPSPLIVPPAPDTKAVALPILVSSTPAATASIPAGRASLSGTVVDALGPVPFATVRLEHHRANPNGGQPIVGSTDVVADESGKWKLADVGGGRWRVRAFVPDQMSSTTPIVRFINVDAAATIDLVVNAPDPSLVLAVTSAPRVFLDDSATIAVSVGRRRVDGDGILVVAPAPGVTIGIELGASSALRLVSVATSVTDGSGIARFGGACGALGPSQGTFSVASGTDGAAAISSRLSDCVAPPPPPSEGSETDPTDPGATTPTTTAPRPTTPGSGVDGEGTND